jgi:hypothetical protein
MGEGVRTLDINPFGLPLFTRRTLPLPALVRPLRGRGSLLIQSVGFVSPTVIPVRDLRGWCAAGGQPATVNAARV